MVKLNAYGKHSGSLLFPDRPIIVTWQARASEPESSSRSSRSDLPGELTTAEAANVIDRIAAHRTPVLVIAGAASSTRADVPELIAHARGRGLRVGLEIDPLRTSSQDLGELAAARLDQILVSLDGPSAEVHDRTSGRAGAFVAALATIRNAADIDLAVQVDTQFSRENFSYREEIARLVQQLSVSTWEVSFSMPRATAGETVALSPGQYNEVFEVLNRVERESEFVLAVREAPHWRRFILEKQDGPQELASMHRRISESVARCAHVAVGAGLAPDAGDTGRGALFIDAVGDIHPSPWLRVNAGNVRTHPIAGVYRHSDLFRELRTHTLLKGKCGACALGKLCGGSRARAHAFRGDYLSPDPACAFPPLERDH